MIRRFLVRWRGGERRLCVHRSHRLRLRCWRVQTSDGLCRAHCRPCRTGCPKETP